MTDLIVSPAATVSVVTNIDGIESTVPMGAGAGAGAATPLNTQTPGTAATPIATSAGCTAVYSSADAAHAVCPRDGRHFVLEAKKNASRGTDADDGWKVYAVIPSFAASLADAGKWAEVVNAAMLAQARDTFKAWRAANPLATEVSLALFELDSLRSDYLAGGAGMSMDRETLEKLFCASATWKRISGSDSFKFNQQYRTVADIFKQKVVSLAGRSHGSLSDRDLDTIAAKLEESDLTTQFGSYVLDRIAQIQKKREESEAEMSLDAL